MSTIKNRSEIIFLYDVKDNNPNGDPLNENKPRIDEETRENYVTDVRLKRTIRDYMALKYNNTKPNKIFMLAERNKDNTLKSMKELTAAFSSIKELVENCVDIRLFGGTIAIKRDKKWLEDMLEFKNVNLEDVFYGFYKDHQLFLIKNSDCIT